MRYSYAVPLSVRHDEINLPDWLFGLTEEDYEACARGHRGCGVIGAELRRGMINVESIGGSLVIQHYVTKRADKDHVTMVSEASRVYLLHVVPVKAFVSWDMQALRDGPDNSIFRCEIEVLLPRAIQILSMTIATPVFLHRHLVEETIGFARDIKRKTLNVDGSRATRR